jgi:hydrogenase maturation factor
VLVHLGIPVEVLEPKAAEEALALRTEGGLE